MPKREDAAYEGELHRIENFATGADEVHCPNTIMSTWRYCPYCGERIRDD